MESGPAPRAGTGGHCPPTSAMCPPTSSYVSTVSRGIFNFLKHFKITWFPEHNKWMITGANSGAKGAYISPPTQLMNIHPKRMVILSEIDKWAKSGHQALYIENIFACTIIYVGFSVVSKTVCV